MTREREWRALSGLELRADEGQPIRLVGYAAVFNTNL